MAGVRVIVGLGLLLGVGPALADDNPPEIRGGAIELGVDASLDSVEGDTRARLGLNAGTFLDPGFGLIEGGVTLGWQRIAGLDQVDTGLRAGWLRALGETPVWAHLAGAATLRYARVGSFDGLRYPLGFDLGARILLSDSAALRVEYRYRRVLSDPVADFDEHGLVLGISWLANNAPTPTAPRR